MNSDCFKVYDTDCQRAPLSSLNSLFFLFFPLSASKIVILQKTITKSLFLKKSDCWAELGSADTLIRSLECVTVTAVTLVFEVSTGLPILALPTSTQPGHHTAVCVRGPISSPSFIQFPHPPPL